MNAKHCPTGLAILCVLLSVSGAAMAQTSTTKNEAETMVQAGLNLTVEQGKRLIAQAVVQMPIVQRALKHGKVIVTKGTTNRYIAEELLGMPVVAGSYVYGRITPKGGVDPLAGVAPVPEVIFIKGEHKAEMRLVDALQQLEAGDVVIKGANALDYENKTAAVMIGAPDSGTTGKIMPYVVARKAHLVIPVGLEKQIGGSVMDMQLKMREPVESLNDVPSMFLITGHIVTELEALKILADVEAFQAAAGGIGGAEGGAWLVVRGPRSSVEKAMRLVEAIQKADAAQ